MKLMKKIDLEWLVDRYDIIIPADVDNLYDLTLQTFDAGLKQRKVIDFDDQLFLPVYDRMTIPKYDWVFVDESQDMNPLQIELLSRCGANMVTVGDTSQAIYGFRGADPDAMVKIKERFHSFEMPLSICYRCARSIVLEAQKIVPHIEYHSASSCGHVETINMEEYNTDVQDGDFVLCRTTAPLVSEALRMIRNKRRASVRGRDIGKGFAEWADHLDDLDKFEQEQLQKLQGHETALIMMQDHVDTVRALLMAYGKDGYKQGVEQLFSDEDTGGITYCTVHRCKGLETDRVFILRPDLMPHPRCTKEWQRTQEMNLKYVAITRAKKELYYVRVD